jgi:hypothetical protein
VPFGFYKSGLLQADTGGVQFSNQLALPVKPVVGMAELERKASRILILEHHVVVLQVLQKPGLNIVGLADVDPLAGV